MGKESEILQAAQAGNVAKLESFLAPKSSKVSFSALSLRRGPNVNWRDESGYTALHLASLNGHKEAVQFLLRSDASANVPDNAGSFALHLAAFNGHHEVARLLIHHGPSRASVNEPNMAGDTALHVAAQYGHRYVLQALVESHADLSLKNNKEESALDLAAQYGKLASVQLFLFCDRSLISDVSRKHTALHLAARNGHEKVVELLLDNEMDINTKCDMGSALHCAALFGKVQVAKFLLERGIDISIVNDEDETVLDVLCKHPSQRSQEITALIYEQAELIAKATEKQTIRSSLTYNQINHEAGGDNKRNSSASARPMQRGALAGYDYVPPPRCKDGSETKVRSPHPSYSVLQVPARSSTRLSDTIDYHLASLTPPHDSEQKFDYYIAVKPPKPIDSPINNKSANAISPVPGYCEVGGIGRGAPSIEHMKNEAGTTRSFSTESHKQRKTTMQPETDIEGSDVYCDLMEPSRSNLGVGEIYQVPPSFLRRSHNNNQQPLDKNAEHQSLVSTPRSCVNSSSSSQHQTFSQFMPPPPPSEAQQIICDTLDYPSHRYSAGDDQLYEPVWCDEGGITNAYQQFNDHINSRNQSISNDNGKHQSSPYPVQEMYDNVNLKNSPKVIHIESTRTERVDSASFLKKDDFACQNDIIHGSVYDIYNNIQISNSPLQKFNQRISDRNSSLPQDLYDNVSINNEPSQNNPLSVVNPTIPTPAECFHSKAVTSDVSFDKNANIETNSTQTLNSPETKTVYEPIKIQRLKQKRTTIRKPTSDMTYTAHFEGTSLVSDKKANTSPTSQEVDLSDDFILQRSSSTISKPQVAPKPALNALPNLPRSTKYADVITTEIKSDLASSKKKQSRTLSHSPRHNIEYIKVEQPIYESKTLPRNLLSQNRNVSEGYRMSQLAPQQSLNEQYEWNKIDSFLTSLEEFATSPGAVQDSAKGAINTENVSLWLESLGMMQYEPAFLVHGFDDIEFLGGALEDADLIELGILYSNDRKKLIDASNDLPAAKVIGDADFPIPGTVEQWLEKIRLKDYANRFIYNGYDNMDRVRVIWELELVTVLEVSTLGHRKRMMNSLGRRPIQITNSMPLSQKEPITKKPPSTINHTFVDDAMDIAKDLLIQAENLKLERAQYRQESLDNSDGIQTSPLYDVVSPNVEGGPKYTVSVTATSQEARSASNRLSHVDPGTVDHGQEYIGDWKHHPDTLLFSSVTYATQYLGSHPVHTVKGVTSTLDACTKMKAISKNVRKMPIIELSISVRGIDYIDANSKIIISSYEIQNISFCAQDPRDVEVFAYITRDVQTGKNYCHVFKAFSPALADEIITTIGQSFHLAYEQHLKLASHHQQRKVSKEKSR